MTEPQRQKVQFFELKNKDGFTVQLMNYGASITKILAPKYENKKKIYENVVLGFDDVENYFIHGGYYGSTIGRVCNRIADGKFQLNGKEFSLSKNNGKNCLHGGDIGFDKKFWSSKISENSIEFSLFSPDGDENFPGNLQITVQFTLTNDNSIIIEYNAVSDEDTIINLTNHSYFNLNGVDNEEDILNHELKLNCDYYTPTNDDLIPTGEVIKVKDELDFRDFKKIGRDIQKIKDGYDHNFVVNNWTNNVGLSLVASVVDPKSGRILNVQSTEPGVQFYTGNFLNGKESGNEKWKKHFAFCLECQHFPDSINQPNFPSIILKKNEKYHQTTIYQFLCQE